MDNISAVIGKYKIIECIGFGTYGKVFSAINTDDEGEVAVKKIESLSDEVDIKRVLREILILKGSKHDNIIALLDVMLVEKCLNKQRNVQVGL